MLISLALLASLAISADAKGEKVAYTSPSSYFEKNTAGLKGEVSYLLFKDAESFDKVFGVATIMGKTPNILPKSAFDTMVVAAVIKRGKALTMYTVDKVTAEGDTLTIAYTAKTGPVSSANYAMPLIVAVDKAKVAKVVFIENGKEVGTAK